MTDKRLDTGERPAVVGRQFSAVQVEQSRQRDTVWPSVEPESLRASARLTSEAGRVGFRAAQALDSRPVMLRGNSRTGRNLL